MHDVTFRRLGTASPAEMSKLASLLRKRGGREVDASAPARLTLLAAPRVSEAQPLIDRLGFADRARTLVIGLEGRLNVRDMTPRPGSFAAFVEQYRPLGVLANAAVRKWRSSEPELISKKQLAERIGCSFHKAKQSAHYAAWLTAPGASAAEMVLTLLAAAEGAPPPISVPNEDDDEAE